MENGSDTDRGRKILWGDCQPSLLSSICNNGGFRTKNKIKIKILLLFYSGYGFQSNCKNIITLKANTTHKGGITW